MLFFVAVDVVVFVVVVVAVVFEYHDLLEKCCVGSVCYLIGCIRLHFYSSLGFCFSILFMSSVSKLISYCNSMFFANKSSYSLGLCEDGFAWFIWSKHNSLKSIYSLRKCSKSEIFKYSSFAFSVIFLSSSLSLSLSLSLSFSLSLLLSLFLLSSLTLIVWINLFCKVFFFFFLYLD